jgi:hypothetical protein
MHEDWLQKYIKEHQLQIGFSELHGPYKYGADYKGVYAQKLVKIEAEWDYADYIRHKHGPGFADVLVVATLAPVPIQLQDILPSIIINLDREKVVQWAEPRIAAKSYEDYYSYPWRKLARNLLYLYAYYQKLEKRSAEYTGSRLSPSTYRNQTPSGFKFGPGGKEQSFSGTAEDKAAWDYWLETAHLVAEHFHLKPALLRATWVDRIAIFSSATGRMTESDIRRFKEVVAFIEELILKKEW